MDYCAYNSLGLFRHDGFFLPLPGLSCCGLPFLPETMPRISLLKDCLFSSAADNAFATFSTLSWACFVGSFVKHTAAREDTRALVFADDEIGSFHALKIT